MPAVLVAAVALSSCGDSSPALLVLEEASGGIGLHCGEISHWEAAVVANDAKEPATITSIRLDKPAPGFTLQWVRAYQGPANVTEESRAKTPALGLTISPSHLADDAKEDGETVGWHLVLGIRTPECAARKGLRPGDGIPEHDYLSAEDGAVVGYRVGGESRSVRIGAGLSICAVPRGFECMPDSPG